MRKGVKRSAIIAEMRRNIEARRKLGATESQRLLHEAQVWQVEEVSTAMAMIGAAIARHVSDYGTRERIYKDVEPSLKRSGRGLSLPAVGEQERGDA